MFRRQTRAWRLLRDALIGVVLAAAVQLGTVAAQPAGTPETGMVGVPTMLPAPETGQGSLGAPGLADQPAGAMEEGMTPTSSPSEDGSTALDGRVRLGPISNMVRPNQPQFRPYSATILVKTDDGLQEVARVTSDDDGLFSVALDAGTYQVVPLPPEGQVRPFSTPQQVSIEPGSHTSMVIHYDSGIR